jgi:anti-sigma factor RsiW
MSAHLAIERLSAYLDDELDGRDSRQVEAHVGECPHCQRRLHGLRRVVDELQRMPTASAPPMLGQALEREASARWRARRDQAFRGQPQSGFEIAQGLIHLSSAMVIAVAMIALVVAHGLARDGAQGTRLVLPPAAGAAEAAAERVEAGGRLFVLAGGVWWQQDLLAGGHEALPEAAARSQQQALARAPWLAELLRRGPVVLELDGVPVLVQPATPPR